MRPQKRLHQRFRLMPNLLQRNGIKGRDTGGKKSQLVITSMSYINLLTQLKNAQAVKKENIKILFSKINETIAKILAANNFIDSIEKKGRGVKRILDIKLKYEKGITAIKGIKLISKPSRKIYIGYKDIRPVKQGYGIMVISTPKGIITNKEAKKLKVGGEALFEIW